MKLRFLLTLLPLLPLHAEGPYPIDPASVRQEGVPKGVTTKHVFKDSKIYPGTERAMTPVGSNPWQTARTASILSTPHPRRSAISSSSPLR